jgi:type II secretion system (T2SS) protein M
LRGYWPLIGAILLFAVLFTVDRMWFQPTAQRHAAAIKLAIELGMPLDPDQMPRLIPPRLFALLGDNSMPGPRAQEAAGSGTLTAEFLGELTRIMSNRDIQILSTDPAPITQDERQVVVRAHIRLRCRYPDFVLLLDDFARNQRLFGVERFVLAPDPSGAVSAELWMSKLIFKSGGAT